MHSAAYSRGLWLGVAAYAIWGLSPLYWKALGDIDALQLLANRVVWAVPILALVVVARGRREQMGAVFRSRATLAIAAIAAAMLATNWGVFIWGVTTDHVVEVSLGYFISPLISVALGVVVLRERLGRAQVAAVALAAGGVLYMTLRVGSVPWVSLLLAFSFAIYGLLKKRRDAAPALEALLTEVSIVAVPGAVWVGLKVVGGDGALGDGAVTTALLVGAGAITALPLLLFGASAQRVPLSVVGLLQYIAPTLQFALGVLAFREPVTVDQLVGFAFVWGGLAVFTFDNVRRSRRGTVVVAVRPSEVAG